MALACLLWAAIYNSSKRTAAARQQNFSKTTPAKRLGFRGDFHRNFVLASTRRR
ncbi:hypothetical protein [Campylobacter sp.]|uniref:hypothetical protein n=1 Tax=Campylobacter sp. TaxID=205 RepID=UPI002A7660B6|nr:hypothetical protein [Campylobacter sp.]MDY2763406.1 hypothetical protein [Campylobacter sp.]